MQKSSTKVVITGVSKGIGWALAKEFLKQNAKVFGCARSQHDFGITNKNFYYQKVDVSNSDQVKGL